MKKITMEDLYENVKGNGGVRVHHGRFYEKIGQNWRPILPADFAVKIRHLYTEDDQKLISSSAVKEVQERLVQDPYIQLQFVDEQTEDFICLRENVFNVATGQILHDEIGDFSYFVDFKYINESDRSCPRFDEYVKSVFPEETEVKRRLLLQILGYCLSDFTKAKAAFFFIGESNSGKSTMLELIKKVLPEQTVTSIPLHRLENRFNLAKLSEARLNLCSEVSEKSLASLDIFKMLTSNETVTAEHKGGKPFEFKIKCKSLNAGNVLPDIKESQGMAAIINRMIVLIFPVSIPKEKQDLSLLDKLYEERDTIFSYALDELTALKKRDFCFVEPKDSQKLKKRMFDQSNVIDNFLHEQCFLQKDAKVYLRDLYEAFQAYCDQNLVDVKYSKTKFSQALAIKPGLEQKKLRISGGKALSGIVGLRLLEEKELRKKWSDKGQDSRMSDHIGGKISPSEIKSPEQWNTGTDEVVAS